MVLNWLRRLGASRNEPEVLTDVPILDSNPYATLRSSQRVSVQVAVEKCEMTPESGGKARRLPVTVVDLSAGGARLVCTEAVEPGDILRLAFKLPKGGGEWKGSGRVTWSSAGGLLAGVQFNTPDTPAERASVTRLARFVEEYAEAGEA